MKRSTQIFPLSILIISLFAISSGSDSLANENPTYSSVNLSTLYSRSLQFDNDELMVTVLVDEARDRINFSTQGEISATSEASASKRVKSSSRLSLAISDSSPGKVRRLISIGTFLPSDLSSIESREKLFRNAGFKVELLTVGATYAIGGKSVDTQRTLVLVNPIGTTITEVEAFLRKNEIQTVAEMIDEPIERGKGTIVLRNQSGRELLRSREFIRLSLKESSRIRMEGADEKAEHRSPNDERRSYRGELFAVVGIDGKLVLVNRLSLEELTQGIVPSEIFASSPLEALKAQAVTARGELMVKAGTRHFSDPYLLCGKEHCQMYRGIGSERERTNRAVRETRGEVLLDANGKLVPSYYSATCGGRSEANENVWNGPPNVSTRSHSDLIGNVETLDLSQESHLHDWLSKPPKSYCSMRTKVSAKSYRWNVLLNQKTIDQKIRTLEIGSFRDLVVIKRGFSGRAMSVRIVGSSGERIVNGELNIRRQFGNLKSAAFLFSKTSPKSGDPTYAFQGAGWGHGVGMCQLGAIGRADSGASYRDILSHYFSGAQPTKIGNE